MKYQVYWMNFQYYADAQFPSFDDALRYGKARGFEFSIIAKDTTVAVYSPIGGLRTYHPELAHSALDKIANAR